MTKPVNPVRRALATTLAALILAPFAPAQTTDAAALRRLQEENAALRRQLEALGVRPAPPPEAPITPGATPTPRTTAPTATTLTTDEGVQKLSPFEVKSDKDYGYLKTNSATATRIGMEIQKVPLSISVFTEDFIRDTGMREIQDVMRYTASAAGDTRMATKAPGNSATPSGNMTLRGFPVSSRLRNGLNRYSYYNMDTVERIEVIKGPASVFFGQGFPGGVINYVTKQPQFADIPTQFSYSYGGNSNYVGSERYTMDVNQVLTPKAALRVVGAVDDTVGTQRYEFKKAWTVAPSMTLIPFDNRKLKINLELEHADSKHNSDATYFLHPEQWFGDYRTPSAALIGATAVDANGVAVAPVANAEAYRARIFNNVGQWIADVRRAAQGNTNALGFDANNNFVAPVALWTTKTPGARYTDASGNRVTDEKFNNRGSGTLSTNEDTTMAITIDASPLDWMDFRYSFTKNHAYYTNKSSQANPYADGNRFNLSGISHRGDRRNSKTHQYDFVLHRDLFRVKHKLLLGGIYDETKFDYYGWGQYMYVNLPGANLNPAVPAGYGGNTFQRVYDRSGTQLNSLQLFSEYDPGIHVTPDISRVTSIDRMVIDRYQPKKEEYYVNYLATLFDDRLNLFAGYRTVNEYDGEQRVSPNPPWYVGYPDLLKTINTPDLIAQYGISDAPGSYHVGTYAVRKGDSQMYGASFAVTKSLNVYASYSQTFLPNTGYLGLWDETLARQRAASIGLNPDAEVARAIAAGANSALKNEEGQNYEFGVKTSAWDSKLVGTFSVFRLLRTNEKLDDSGRQIDEPLNYSGPNKSGTFSTANGGIRWYSNSSERKVEGTEAEIIWTPLRNYQVFANASWLWTAETIKDPTILDPNTPGLTAAQKRQHSQNSYFAYQFRMPNVPEYRVNLNNRYTFTEGRVKGLTVTLGARYASVMNISNDINFNSKKGGLTAGDYLVFDGSIGLPWAVFGVKVYSGLQVSNLTDKEYNEGSGGLRDATFYGSPPRTWWFSNSVRF